MSNKQVKLPRVLRCHQSGVWFGYVIGEGDVLPVPSLKIEGRRVWSWEGDRLETSQLATKGLREKDQLGDWIENELPVSDVVDCLKTTEELVEAAKALPST